MDNGIFMKAKTDFSYFEALDIRIGRILSVEESRAKKPTYKIIVDFGSEIGKKTTIGAYRNYTKDELIGKLVVGLINVGEKRMGRKLLSFYFLVYQTKRRKRFIWLLNQKCR